MEEIEGTAEEGKKRKGEKNQRERR